MIGTGMTIISIRIITMMKTKMTVTMVAAITNPAGRMSPLGPGCVKTFF